MEFKDYTGKKISLSEDSWQHIKETHPEIDLTQIGSTLNDPLEVRKSISAPSTVERLYPLQ